MDGTHIATLGEIHPDVAERFGIDRRVYVAEVDLDALRPLEKPALRCKAAAEVPGGHARYRAGRG